MFMSTPLFTTSQVAAAAGIPEETLRTWIKRGEIRLVKDVPPPDQPHRLAEDDRSDLKPGTGRSRVFSLRKALHIALVAELAKVGIPIVRASELALRFTDIGETVAFWESEGPPPDIRAPGHLFSTGTTVFRLFATDALDASVDRMEDLEPSELLFYRGKPATTLIVVNMNDLVRRVRSALGILETR